VQRLTLIIVEFHLIKIWTSHLRYQRNIGKTLILLISFIFSVLYVSAQNKSALQSQRKQLEEKIKLTETELDRTKSSKKTSITALKTLSIKIKSREKLISTYKSEISLSKKRISEYEDIISSLNTDIESLKDEYSEMIVAAYKNKNSDNAMHFLFSSQDFNDMIRRVRYLQYYSDHRKRQYELIEKTKTDLEENVEDLKKSKTELENLLVKQSSQINTLSVEKTEKDELVKALEGSESALKEQLTQQKVEAKKLTQQIEKIIKEEQKKATAAAGTVAASKTTKNKSTASSTTYALTPEAQLISKNFNGNKGKLPWPVERGYVSSSFGNHASELRNNLETPNNGVDITTSSDASVRSIFEGKVLSIVFNPGFQKAIIISHGDYFSVYANLS